MSLSLLKNHRLRNSVQRGFLNWFRIVWFIIKLNQRREKWQNALLISRLESGQRTSLRNISKRPATTRMHKVTAQKSWELTNPSRTGLKPKLKRWGRRGARLRFSTNPSLFCRRLCEIWTPSLALSVLCSQVKCWVQSDAASRWMSASLAARLC